jgi:hypothetical protein
MFLSIVFWGLTTAIAGTSVPVSIVEFVTSASANIILIIAFFKLQKSRNPLRRAAFQVLFGSGETSIWRGGVEPPSSYATH